MIIGDKNNPCISLQQSAFIGDVSLSNIPLFMINIQWNDNIPSTILTAFKTALTKACSGSTINYYTHSASSSSTNSKITSILDKVFNTIIGVTMFLCFFALSANMSANLYEQTKEIGVLRSIGFTKNRIKMLYFYEAMILILASCLMGLMIGMMIAYTMIVQETMILSKTLGVFFPWRQFLVIMVLSFICAFFSTFGPTTLLTNKPISAIFRLI